MNYKIFLKKDLSYKADPTIKESQRLLTKKEKIQIFQKIFEAQKKFSTTLLPSTFAVKCVSSLIKHLKNSPNEECAVQSVNMLSYCIKDIDPNIDEIARALKDAKMKFPRRFWGSVLIPEAEKCETYLCKRIFGNALVEELRKTTKDQNVIDELLSQNPEFSPAGRARVVGYLLDVNVRPATKIDTALIKQLLNKGIEYADSGMTRAQFFKKLCEKVPSNEVPSFNPIEINGHTYYAIGPTSALRNNDVSSVSDFVTKVSGHSILINLMGGWQLNQQGVVYIRPSQSDTSRNDALKCCRETVQALVSLVNPAFTVPDSGLNTTQLQEMIKDYTEDLASRKVNQICKIATRAVTELGEDPLILSPLIFAKDKACSLLRSVNLLLGKILSEEENFQAFEKLYTESGCLGNSIRVFDKKGQPQHHAYEVCWNERTGVHKDNATDEEVIVREANALIEHMNEAYILAQKLNEDTVPFVHCAKGVSRTGNFLLLLELFRNKNLLFQSDDEIQAFICSTTIQLGLTDTGRMSDLRAIFDVRFIQAFRDAGRGRKPKEFEAGTSSDASSLITAAAAAGLATTSLTSVTEVRERMNALSVKDN